MSGGGGGEAGTFATSSLVDGGAISSAAAASAAATRGGGGGDSGGVGTTRQEQQAELFVQGKGLVAKMLRVAYKDGRAASLPQLCPKENSTPPLEASDDRSRGPIAGRHHAAQNTSISGRSLDSASQARKELAPQNSTQKLSKRRLLMDDMQGVNDGAITPADQVNTTLDTPDLMRGGGGTTDHTPLNLRRIKSAEEEMLATGGSVGQNFDHNGDARGRHTVDNISTEHLLIDDLKLLTTAKSTPNSPKTPPTTLAPPAADFSRMGSATPPPFEKVFSDSMQAASMKEENEKKEESGRASIVKKISVDAATLMLAELQLNTEEREEEKYDKELRKQQAEANVELAQLKHPDIKPYHEGTAAEHRKNYGGFTVKEESREELERYIPEGLNDDDKERCLQVHQWITEMHGSYQ